VLDDARYVIYESTDQQEHVTEYRISAAIRRVRHIELRPGAIVRLTDGRQAADILLVHYNAVRSRWPASYATLNATGKCVVFRSDHTDETLAIVAAVSQPFLK